MIAKVLATSAALVAPSFCAATAAAMAAWATAPLVAQSSPSCLSLSSSSSSSSSSSAFRGWIDPVASPFLFRHPCAAAAFARSRTTITTETKKALTGGGRTMAVCAAAAMLEHSAGREDEEEEEDEGATAGGSRRQRPEFALIFDCDGVIIETEELHRLAYNAAFEDADLRIDGKLVNWSVEYYDVLQNTVGGGKPKMFYHFRETERGRFPTYRALRKKGGGGDDKHDEAEYEEEEQERRRPAPESEEERQALVDMLQSHKTELYKRMVEERARPRPGVIELMDEALADPSMAVGICSASTKEAAIKVLDVVLGQDRRERLDVCILGNDVSKLKPDPLIYVTAAERIGIHPSRCVVVEDSMIGLKAAKGAGMRCLITYTSSTESEDFYGEGADAKVPDLGSRGVTLDKIFGPMKEFGLDAEIVADARDPVPSSV